MGTVMGIDNQDVVSRMEGFAIQGVKGTFASGPYSNRASILLLPGAVSNHVQLVSQVRAAIRDIINQKLRQSILIFISTTSHLSKEEITGDPDAKMQWVHYFRNIIQRYSVAVEGWPDCVPFTNLSSVSSALPHLEILRQNWHSGTTHWKQLTDEEFEELLAKRNQQLDNGEITLHARRSRSDKGKKHKRASDSENDNHARHAKKGKSYKSASVVPSDSEPDGDTQVPTVNGDQNAPSSVPPVPNAGALATIFGSMSSSDQERLMNNVDSVPQICTSASFFDIV
jgi:hypothetical protein